MRKVLALLAVLAIVSPAWSQYVDYFGVTADGSFDSERSSEGYSNAGSVGTPRISKANQHIGWMSFNGAVGDNSGQSLAAFLAANPSAQATLHFRMSSLQSDTSKLTMVSIRSGNQGNLVEDTDADGYGTPSVPGTGFTGSSQMVAFRGATVPQTGFSSKGDGIYIGNLPANGDGEAWIAPSGRLPLTGGTFKFSAGDPIRYDISGNPATPTGLYRGFVAGGNFWALEDLLGMRADAGGGMANSPQAVLDAGQIFAKDGLGNMLKITNADYNGTDVRNNSGTAGWKALPLDAAFLADIASNPEHKGFVFTSRILNAGLSDDWNNASFFAQDQSGGAYEAYIAVTPEPATMVLLALGGMALLRRRSA